MAGLIRIYVIRKVWRNPLRAFPSWCPCGSPATVACRPDRPPRPRRRVAPASRPIGPARHRRVPAHRKGSPPPGPPCAQQRWPVALPDRRVHRLRLPAHGVAPQIFADLRRARRRGPPGTVTRYNVGFCTAGAKFPASTSFHSANSRPYQALDRRSHRSILRDRRYFAGVSSRQFRLRSSCQDGS